MDNFYEMLNDKQLFTTGYKVITNEQGVILYSPAMEDIGKHKSETKSNYQSAYGEGVFYKYANSILNNSKSLVVTIPVDITNEISFGISLIAPLNEINGDMGQNINKLMMITTVSLILLILVIIFVINFIISKSLYQLKNLVGISSQISKGDFNFKIPDYKNDEIGNVFTNFIKMSDTIKVLINDIQSLSEKHNAGEINARLDHKKYEGMYSRVAKTTSDMVEDYSVMISDVIEFSNNFVKGNFNIDIKD